jgi:hypothetical protein
MRRPTPTLIAAILSVALSANGLAQAQQITLHRTPSHNDWPLASTLTSAQSIHKLFVVTSAQPTQRHTCRVHSFTADQLVCKAALGKTRTYKPQEISALITPGDNDIRLRGVLGFNGALAAATWGTVLLAPICIPCAVATGIAALLFFDGAAVTLIADGQPEAILYLAPNQVLQAKLN